MAKMGEFIKLARDYDESKALDFIERAKIKIDIYKMRPKQYMILLINICIRICQKTLVVVEIQPIGNENLPFRKCYQCEKEQQIPVARTLSYSCQQVYAKAVAFLLVI